jgi:hypothetical protein
MYAMHSDMNPSYILDVLDDRIARGYQHPSGSGVGLYDLGLFEKAASND